MTRYDSEREVNEKKRNKVKMITLCVGFKERLGSNKWPKAIKLESSVASILKAIILSLMW